MPATWAASSFMFHAQESLVEELCDKTLGLCASQVFGLLPPRGYDLRLPALPAKGQVIETRQDAHFECSEPHGRHLEKTILYEDRLDAVSQCLRL